MNTHISYDKQYWIPGFVNRTPIFEPLQILQPHIDSYRSWPTLENLQQLKNRITQPIFTQSGHPICFTNEKPQTGEFADLYEPKIYLTGKIQTRLQNWHDFFNALVWMTFPYTKATLNHIHFQTMQQKRPQSASQRGPLRDAATLFDESGIVILSSHIELIELLQKRRWKKLFWLNRELVQSNMKFFVFGHALFEKSLNPYVGMTAKGIIFNVENSYFKQPLSSQLSLLDNWLAKFVQEKLKTPANLVPVPLLGYPGWSKENNVHTYYDNSNYFRPPPTLDTAC